jgi:hypothetical protein
VSVEKKRDEHESGLLWLSQRKKRMHIEAVHHDLRERRRMSMEAICGDCHKEDKWLQKKKTTNQQSSRQT